MPSRGALPLRRHPSGGRTDSKTETGELQFTETGAFRRLYLSALPLCGEYQTLHTVNGASLPRAGIAVDLFPSFVAGSLEELLCAGAAGNPLFSTEQLCGLLQAHRPMRAEIALPARRPPAGRLDSAAVKRSRGI